MNKFLPVFALAFVACDSSGAQPAASGSAAADASPTASSKPKADTTANADTPAPAAAAAPADPLDDSGKVVASCDTMKTEKMCREYFDLGMTEDVTKDLCTGGMGKWEKGKACPTDKRMAVCRADTMRSVYYDGYIDPSGEGLPGLEKQCAGIMLGKFAAVPKK
jgi:hypothetical protein